MTCSHARTKIRLPSLDAGHDNSHVIGQSLILRLEELYQRSCRSPWIGEHGPRDVLEVCVTKQSIACHYQGTALGRTEAAGFRATAAQAWPSLLLGGKFLTKIRGEQPGLAVSATCPDDRRGGDRQGDPRGLSCLPRSRDCRVELGEQCFPCSRGIQRERGLRARLLNTLDKEVGGVGSAGDPTRTVGEADDPTLWGVQHEQSIIRVLAARFRCDGEAYHVQSIASVGQWWRVISNEQARPRENMQAVDPDSHDAQ